MSKRKLSGEEKRRKKARRAAFMTVFINGKQKRVPRPPMIDGLPVISKRRCHLAASKRDVGFNSYGTRLCH